MKPGFYWSVFLIMITLNSCENLFINDSPGNIPGMGANSGKLQIGEPFTLPEGIILIDSITEGTDGSLTRIGSGSVHLKISLLNYSDNAKTVFFPKSLIFKCNSPDNHNLLLLQTCWICLEPNRSKTFILDSYCINNSRKHPADPGITFEILGLSGSKVIINLLNFIDWRKIDYEMIIGSPSTGKLDAYLEIMEPLRDLVWRLTADTGITNEDIKFIEKIPELSASEIPQKDNLGQFPDYFDEYVVKAN